MLFNSGAFLFAFLPIALLGYLLLSRIVRSEYLYLWLILASLFFYGWWYPPYLSLLICSILINYYLGAILRSSRKRRKPVLILGVLFNLGLIAYFKYALFFVENFNELAGSDFHVAHIALPLAISFFTFQQIAYLVDSYRHEVLPHGIVKYGLFVSFFPQLIAGPIVHHSEFFSQIDAKIPTVTHDKLAMGLSIFFIGLFKKVIIADQLALYATPVFNNAESGKVLTFFEAWGGVLSYTHQLYFDFSGYSDMAIGLALLFGIYLPLNFNSPYKATSIIDFWRRWHITLSHFLRNYLYITLGGNRKGARQRYINLMVTMMLGGLWHGASWTFVAWGTLHGVYLVINHLWRSLLTAFNCRCITNFIFYKLIAFVLTYLAVIIAWVFFRAGSFTAALSILQSMSGLNGISLPIAFAWLADDFNLISLNFNGTGIHGGAWAVFWIGVSMSIALFLPNTQQLMGKRLTSLINPAITGSTIMNWKPNLIWVFMLSLLAGTALVMVMVGRSSEFLYFQF
jgi:D-alanyl-lipoteichoic acid acyltransferase DltB (MBOAT superfamily)